MSETEHIEYVVVEKKKRSLLYRLGCGILLVIWFMILLLPLVMIILASQGSISVAHGGDIPDKHEHPLFEVDLIMEMDYRGLQFTNSTINRDGDTALCLQTNVRYLLWQGEGDAAQFCDCYTREDAEDDWGYVDTVIGACE